MQKTACYRHLESACSNAGVDSDARVKSKPSSKEIHDRRVRKKTSRAVDGPVGLESNYVVWIAPANAGHISGHLA